MDELDLILTRAGGVDRFLANAELIDRYFIACQGYYGQDRFFREPYDRILLQLRELQDRIPGLKERLFETRDLGRLTIVKGIGKTYGRGLNRERWGEWLECWINALLESSGERAATGGFEDDLAGILLQLEKITEEASEAEKKVSLERSRRARTLRRAEVFKPLFERTDVSRLAERIIVKYLRSPQTRPLLLSEDPDLILNELNAARSDPKRVLLKSDLAPGFSFIQNVIKRKIPTLRELLTHREMFPDLTTESHSGQRKPVGAGKAVDYEFKPIPRRFHGIFKGIPSQECLAGNLEGSVHPARWAGVAVAGSELLYLEIPTQQRRYKGFIQIMPLKRDDGESFSGIEFQAPLLSKMVSASSPASGEAVTARLFSHWIAADQKAHSPLERKLLVGSDLKTDNSGCMLNVLSSFHYALGTDQGEARRFSIDDPMAGLLAESYPRTERAQFYSRSKGELIIAATMPHAHRLRRLLTWGGD